MCYLVTIGNETPFTPKIAKNMVITYCNIDRLKLMSTLKTDKCTNGVNITKICEATPTQSRSCALSNLTDSFLFSLLCFTVCVGYTTPTKEGKHGL